MSPGFEGPSQVDLADPSTYRAGIPHAVFRQLRALDPVSWREEIHGPGYWAVTRYADAVEVLAAPATFSSWRGGVQLTDPPPAFLDKLRENMLNRDPPSHTAMRALVHHAFSGSRMSRLRERIRGHARELVERVKASGTCDFATEIAGEMPLFVICEILGVPGEDRGWLYGLTARMFGSEIEEPHAAFADAMRAADELRAYGAELVRYRTHAPGEDVMSDLAVVDPARGKLTGGELRALFALLFNAGADTTRTLLALGLDLLIDRPETMARLRRRPDLLPGAVEEMLRYESPVIQFRRTANRDTVLGGQRIAEGAKVVVFFPSANRDEAAFPDADTFDIGRAPNDHLAFGRGVHLCLGATLARLQAARVFAAVLSGLDEIERAGPTILSRTSFIRSVRRLPIVFRPRRRPDAAADRDPDVER